MVADIDFSKIRPHGGSQHHGFEELCFQLVAVIENLPQGTTLDRHGTPDGGVEFLTTLPDGSVWGWQAKYLFRLGDGEFGQLDRSVRTALDSQPHLTRYTFCLPYNRPAGQVSGRKSAMQKWKEHCDKWARWAVERGMTVDFSYIGESELLAALTLPGQEGRARYWFDATILTPEWFKATVDLAIEVAGPRYTPELNVELPIASVFDGLGRTQEFQTRLRVALREVRDKRRWWSLSRDAPAKDAELTGMLDRCRASLDELDKQIMAVHVVGASPVDFDGLAAHCQEAIDALEQAVEYYSNKAGEVHRGLPAEAHESEKDRQTRQTWESSAWELRRTASALWALKDLLLSDAARLVNVPALLIRGGPGTGKTHLLCDVAQTRREASQPTVMLLGQWFSREEPWTQVLRQLHLDCSVDEFLGALDVAAETTSSRALIFIDALNESEGWALWHDYLQGFLAKVRRWPRLGVAMSCRTSYVDVVIPEELDESKLVRINHEGFAGHEYPAVRAFFEHYRLILPDFPLLVPEFQNPLFLKLMCRGLSEAGIRTVPRGSTGVTWLFNLFLDSVEKRISRPDRCDYAEQDRLVRKATDAIAREMLTLGQDWLPSKSASNLTESLLPSRGWERSLLNALLSEGVLMQELVRRNGETVEGVLFSYQRLGDHLRAAMLCESSGSVEALASECKKLTKDRATAYRHSGLLEALSVQVPERFGQEVHELVSDPRLEPIAEAYLESLVWRDLKAFPSPLSLDYLNKVVRESMLWDDSVIVTLLQVACIPGHPFNADRLHSTLWRLSMPDRDSWWSIFLHRNSEEGGPVTRVIDWAWSEDTSYCADDAALLCATTLAWYLTTSNRFVRDRATKALVSLLKDRLSVLVDLLKRFHGINDPYVAERVYAVAYGCCLISSDKSKIARVAEVVFSQVFADGQPPVHVLLRDYARGVIERALQVGCSLESIDLAKVRPPYRSPWPLRPPTLDSLKKRFYDDRDWSPTWFSVMSSMGDFRDYVINTTVQDFLAPNQRKRLAAARKAAKERAEESWQRFVKGLSQKQITALRRPDGWERVESILSREQLSEFLSAQRDQEWARSEPRSVTFDTDLAARWIFSKVVKLGWTPRRFAGFDQTVGYHVSRTDHKYERIGKKYQWIAFHELVARIADHCLLEPDWGDATPRAYEGAWQLSIRNIDPSLLLSSTKAVHWETTPECWWAPVSARIQEDCTPEAREQWLRSETDLPPPTKLIDLTDPEGKRWLTLEGYYEWQEQTPPEVDRYDVDRCCLWYQVKSYLVRSSDLPFFADWAKGRNWMGRWMPEAHDFYKVFLGEYPWHPSAADTLRNWEEPGEDQDRKPPVPILVTGGRYVCEGSGFDCSVEESVSGLVPSSPLVSSLGLNWEGKALRYVDAAGRAIAWNPTVDARGPSALLINHEVLAEYLEQQQLSIVWTILGEKLVMGPLLTGRSHLPRLEVYGAFVLDGGDLRQIELACHLVPLDSAEDNFSEEPTA